MSLRILIVDDEDNLPHLVARFLKKRGYECVCAADGVAGLKELNNSSFDLVLLDLNMPNMGGLEMLEKLRALDQELPVIILTAIGEVKAAVIAMKLGAFDYLLKPFDLDELLLVVQRALETSAMYRELRQLRCERSEHYHFGYLVGHSERMREVFDLVAKVAPSDASVLITGESGTGKEVVAHAIHEQSQRASGPFHPLNCAAIASNLLESELFGYEQYAFTDAKKQKRGLLELADGGTLFLDEIGEMPVDMQAKLLRVLETRSFYRLGGSKEVNISVRILAATNRDMDQAREDGQFRSDLFYRLAVFQIPLPPLRERPDDILFFAARFIEDFNTSLGRNVRSLAPATQRLLRSYLWPGNVRELKNVIERAMILSNGTEILPAHLPREIVEHMGHVEQMDSANGLHAADPWEQWLNMRPLIPIALDTLTERVERYFVRWALETSKHQRSRAIELLGLNKVDQLRYLMRKHNIE